MTSIPPLISSIPSATTARSATSDGSDSATSFSDLLDGPPAGAPPQPHIYSFAELGMFGRHGAQSLPGTPPEPETATVANPAAIAAPVPALSADKRISAAKVDTLYMATRGKPDLQPPARRPVSQTEIGSAPAAAHPLATGHTSAAVRSGLSPTPVAWKVSSPDEPVERAPETLPIAQPGENGLAMAAKPGTPSAASAEEPVSETNDTVLPEEAVATGVDNEQPFAQSASPGETPSSPGIAQGARAATPQRAAPVRLAQPANRGTDSPNTVSLVVSGSGDDLVIVARSAGETAEETARIRRAVEETAAEFGVDVSEFQLNGSQVDAASPIAAGGKNGNRAR
jgi:hypothetical protein